MLNINKEGVLCKIAYGWGYDKYPPETTNLCNFFWRTLLSFIFVWPFIVLTRIFGWVVRIIGAPIALILWGYRPAGPDWRMLGDLSPLPFVPIRRWPKWKGTHSRFELVDILIVVGCFGTLCFLVYIVAYVFLWKWVFMGYIYNNSVGRISTWSVVGILTLAVIYSIIRKAEWWQMTTEYFRARKEKFCPIVTIK